MKSLQKKVTKFPYFSTMDSLFNGMAVDNFKFKGGHIFT